MAPAVGELLIVPSARPLASERVKKRGIDVFGNELEKSLPPTDNRPNGRIRFGGHQTLSYSRTASFSSNWPLVCHEAAPRQRHL